LNKADREIRSGHWNRESNRGHELDGKTVGIIGYGNMRNFAKNFAVLSGRIVLYSRGNVAMPMQNRFLEELQQKSDVLSLHIPWTPETNKMVDAASMLLRSLWVFNTSRGKNIVTADLQLPCYVGRKGFWGRTGRIGV
jgi:D-3-phosphoglycerate dehydrogenase